MLKKIFSFKTLERLLLTTLMALLVYSAGYGFIIATWGVPYSVCSKVTSVSILDTGLANDISSLKVAVEQYPHSSFLFAREHAGKFKEGDLLYFTTRTAPWQEIENVTARARNPEVQEECPPPR